jgi:hypothetical protein
MTIKIYGGVQRYLCGSVLKEKVGKRRKEIKDRIQEMKKEGRVKRSSFICIFQWILQKSNKFYELVEIAAQHQLYF